MAIMQLEKSVTWLQRLRYAAQSGRPITSLLAGLATAYPAYAAHKGLRHANTPELLFAAGAMALLTAAGFLLNDVADAAKDAAAGKPRPIAMGLLQPRAAMYFAASTLLLALFLALPFATGYSLVTFLLTAALVVLYSAAAKRAPVLKNLYVALLCSLPVAYGFLTIDDAPPFRAISVIAAFVTFRELLLDASDGHSDAVFGINTLAVVIGPPRAARIAWFGMIGASLLGLFICKSGAAGAWLTLTFLTVCISFAIHEQRPALSLNLTRISLLAGILGLGSMA